MRLRIVVINLLACCVAACGSDKGGTPTKSADTGGASGAPATAGAGQGGASSGGGTMTGSCTKQGGSCTTAMNTCCSGACIESTNTDWAGCRATCNASTDCDTGCCMPFTSTSGGFCTDAKYCTCGAVGAACGRMMAKCCDGSTCDAFNSGPFTCYKQCMTAADCPPGGCCSPITGETFGACKSGGC